MNTDRYPLMSVTVALMRIEEFRSLGIPHAEQVGWWRLGVLTVLADPLARAGFTPTAYSHLILTATGSAAFNHSRAFRIAMQAGPGPWAEVRPVGGWSLQKTLNAYIAAGISATEAITHWQPRAA